MAETAGSISQGWFGGTEKTSDPDRASGPIQTRPGARENGNDNINFVPLTKKEKCVISAVIKHNTSLQLRLCAAYTVCVKQAWCNVKCKIAS